MSVESVRLNALSPLIGRSCAIVELALPLSKESTVCHVSFSPDAQSVVACRGKEALVYNTKVILTHRFV